MSIIELLFGIIIGYLILMPLSVLIHVLGHVLPILINEHRAQINLGKGTVRLVFSSAKLENTSTLFPFGVGPTVSLLLGSMSFVFQRSVASNHVVFHLQFTISVSTTSILNLFDRR